MKKLDMILPLALILCFMVGCQDKEAMAELEAMKAQAEVEEENKALAERYIEAWTKGDVAALKEILSPDFVHHPRMGVDESLEEAFEGLKERMTMFPDQNLQVQDLIVKGDKFVFRGIFSGTHTGDSEWIPATGKKVEIRGFAIMRVENGRIVEDWGITDLLDFHEQLGYEIKRKKD
jgi:steroid delta-isomerase-like uncharacterized protein